MKETKLKIVGKNAIRLDGKEKVTGKAMYGDDLKFPGMLYCACRYSDIPAGKILNIDYQKAESSKGVKAVATYSDIPGEKLLGPIRSDQFALVKDEVFFTGDVIAVIAADTYQQAVDAVNKIDVEYQPLEGVFDPIEALKKETRLVHPEYKSNLVVQYPLIKGNLEKGFEESDQVIERTYRTGFQEHAYIEPESVTLVPDSVSGGVDVYGSIQNPYTTRKQVTKFLNLKMNQVNVHGSTLGGTFGGKDDVINMMACRAGLLSLKTNKPVQLTNLRESSLKESYKRHPYVLKYKVGFTNNGTLKAMDIDLTADSGAYSSQSFFVTWRSVVQATGPYEIENVKTDVKAAYTNNCYTAAFRGFGSPQIIFAQESLMDEIADLCNITPYEIRKLNGYKSNSTTASGQVLKNHVVSLNEVMEKAVVKSDYLSKYNRYLEENKHSERIKKGIGLSCSFRGCSLGAEGIDATSAIVSAQADGSIYVMAGLNENGQGMRTTFSMIVAEILGIPLNSIVFLTPQTANITDGGPTVASRGTIMGGSATELAAQEVKKRIFEAIKTKLEVGTIEETCWENSSIFNINKPSLKISFAEACDISYWDGVNLSAYGWFKSPEVSWEEETGQGHAYFTYVYGCQIVELEIDTFTGKIEVENITAAHDVGRVINKQGAEGQIYGGVLQGMGYGLLEDFHQQNGVVKSRNFDTYLIPTIKDFKKINAILVENPDKYGPFGGKSLGEPTLELTAAALNNAVGFALNKRFYQIPLSLEQVFLGKHLRKPERSSEKGNVSHKTYLPNSGCFNIINPTSLKDALDLLNKNDYQIIAGGTDVLIQNREIENKANLLNISGLKELNVIKEFADRIEIGSGVVFDQIINHDGIISNYPVLVAACNKIGSTQIRNRATIAGNIVNAAPCADSVPPLILYSAKVYLTSANSTRVVDVQDFIKRSYSTIIQDNEILTKIVIPKSDVSYYNHYYQLGRRNAVNITRMSISILMNVDDKGIIEDSKLVDGSLLSHPQRLSIVEESLNGKKLSIELIRSIEQPMKEFLDKELGKRWSAPYKIPVFINLLKAGLEDIYKQRLNHD